MTPGSAPTSKPEDATQREDAGKLSEAEFLRQEADRARQALMRTWGDAKAHLLHGADPRAWAGEHPWIALGGAAVAGFVAAAVLIPSKEEQALKKLAALERALSGVEPGAPAAATVAPTNGDAAATKARHGWMSTLALELIKTIRPALVSALTAGIAAKTATDDDSDNQQSSDYSSQMTPENTPPPS